MNLRKIKEIENEVKELHLNPKQTKHSAVKRNIKEIYNLFWKMHLKPVIETSKKLAKKYNANLEVVWLAAMFHDISRLDDKEPHDKISADRTYKLLLKKGFNKKVAEEVKQAILAHRCRDKSPKTLEQKILATADALNHFQVPFYLWFSWISNKTFKEQLKTNLQKMERGFNKKIFFKDEKESIKKEYQILKKWCEYYKKI